MRLPCRPPRHVLPPSDCSPLHWPWRGAIVACRLRRGRGEPLVSAQWLKAQPRRLRRGRTRHSLRARRRRGAGLRQGPHPGRCAQRLRQGRLAGDAQRHPLHAPRAVPELGALIGELGIDEDSHVVVVAAGVHVLDFGAAARVYWTLKAAGHQRVSISTAALRPGRRTPPSDRDRHQAAVHPRSSRWCSIMD